MDTMKNLDKQINYLANIINSLKAELQRFTQFIHSMEQHLNELREQKFQIKRQQEEDTFIQKMLDENEGYEYIGKADGHETSINRECSNCEMPMFVFKDEIGVVFAICRECGNRDSRIGSVMENV